MTVSLQDVKDQLHVLHDQDDALLERLILSATNEYAQFINADPSSSDLVITDDACNGIVLMVRADYEVDPEKRPALRKAAETLWMPYRTGLGI